MKTISELIDAALVPVERVRSGKYGSRAKDNPPLILTETEKAYLAGFWDGEGSIFIHRDYTKAGKVPVHNPAVSIATTDYNTMIHVANKVGLDLRSKKPKNPKHRTVYSMGVHGSGKVDVILDAIYPYLITKKKQADIVYKLIKHKKENAGKRLTSEMIEYREDLFFECSALNVKKGLHARKPVMDRIHYCYYCSKVLPDDFRGKLHPECERLQYKEKYGATYQRAWYRKFHSVPQEMWRKP